MLLLLVLLLALVAFLWNAHQELRRRVDELEDRIEYVRHQADPQTARPERLERPAEAAPLEPAFAEPVAFRYEPVPEPEIQVYEESAEEERAETFANLFEQLVGGRLLIWIGGVALAVAGVFLVRYSIEIGLITPPVRMIMAGLFGLVLIGAGEFARGRGGGDQRIAQALVGAGIFVLYAATYGSLTLYGLISVGAASAMMALITAAALALALRHGVPTAVMGLAGGFLTPLLVGDPDAGAVPLLVYLALLNGAIFALAWRRGWSWLAAAAILLTFLWTMALMLGGADDALAGGVFVLAFAIAASFARAGTGREARLLQPAGIALVELAILVGRGDIGAPAWALFGALAAASLILARRREYRLLPAAALLIALILIALRSGLDDSLAPLAAAATTLLFGGFGAWGLLQRRDEPELSAALASAAIAAPALILRLAEPALLARPLWALLFAALAAAAAAIAWMRRTGDDALSRLPVLLLSGTAAVLLMATAFDLLPTPWLAAGWIAVAVTAAGWSRAFAGRGLGRIALAVTTASSLIAFVQLVPLWQAILGSLAGDPALAPTLPPPLDALRLLLIPAAGLIAVRHLLADESPETRRLLALVALGAALLGLYLLFKHAWSLSDAGEFVARGFVERMLITHALFALGWACSGRFARLHAPLLATGFTVLAAGRFVWFDLLVHNPALTDQWVGPIPILNLILPAYIGAAAWLWAARMRGGALAQLWLWLSLGALTAGIMLLVRQAFQGAILAQPDMPRAEFYGYSLAGLLLAVALLWAGVRRRDTPLRVAGLALLTATVLKVFLIDAAALEGLLRILSFLGLGVALIGVGKLYATVLKAERRGGS